MGPPMWPWRCGLMARPVSGVEWSGVEWTPHDQGFELPGLGRSVVVVTPKFIIGTAPSGVGGTLLVPFASKLTSRRDHLAPMKCKKTF